MPLLCIRIPPSGQNGIVQRIATPKPSKRRVPAMMGGNPRVFGIVQSVNVEIDFDPIFVLTRARAHSRSELYTVQ